MMQNLMNNPEIIQQVGHFCEINSDHFPLQQMMQNNPQVQALLEQRPELAHVLNDPETIRRAMQVLKCVRLSSYTIFVLLCFVLFFALLSLKALTCIRPHPIQMPCVR
jgi:hypothetical protein